MNPSTTELFLGLVSLVLTIYIFIKKQAFFQGRQSVKQERDDKNDEVVARISKDLSLLEGKLNSISNNMNHVEREQKLLSERVLVIDKAFLLQDAKFIQLEKLFDRILVQNGDIQFNIAENSKAVYALNASVEGVRSLLDNLIKGNLTIGK